MRKANSVFQVSKLREALSSLQYITYASDTVVSWAWASVEGCSNLALAGEGRGAPIDLVGICPMHQKGIGVGKPRGHCATK